MRPLFLLIATWVLGSAHAEMPPILGTQGPQGPMMGGMPPMMMGSAPQMPLPAPGGISGGMISNSVTVNTVQTTNIRVVQPIPCPPMPIPQPMPLPMMHGGFSQGFAFSAPPPPPRQVRVRSVRIRVKSYCVRGCHRMARVHCGGGKRRCF